MARTTGILGGSFNPPHLGHVRLATEVADRVDLDRLVVIVAGDPPHKGDEEVVPARHRLAMTRAAFRALDGVEVSDREIRRPGPSYTVDTLEELHEEDPSAELLLVVGADVIPDLPSWHDLPGIVRRARLVICSRPGHDPGRVEAVLGPEVGREAARRIAADVVPIRAIDVSATEVRRRIRRGEPWRHLVPPAVATYVEEQGLYAVG